MPTEGTSAVAAGTWPSNGKRFSPDWMIYGRSKHLSLSRDTRNERKLKAIRRAEFALKQRIDRIDWEEDVLLPEVNAFKAKAQLPELPEGELITAIEVELES